jgi:hypothetical protein
MEQYYPTQYPAFQLHQLLQFQAQTLQLLGQRLQMVAQQLKLTPWQFIRATAARKQRQHAVE